MLEKMKEVLYDPKALKIIGTVVGAVLGAVVTGFVVKAVNTSPSADFVVDAEEALKNMASVGL